MDPAFQVPVYKRLEPFLNERIPHATKLSENEREQRLGPEGGEIGACPSVM